MIIELTPKMDEKYLLVRLIDDKAVAPKKKPEKRSLEKAIEEVEQSAKIESLQSLTMYST